MRGWGWEAVLASVYGLHFATRLKYKDFYHLSIYPLSLYLSMETLPQRLMLWSLLLRSLNVRKFKN